MKTWVLAAATLLMAVPFADAAQVTARLIYATNTPAPSSEKGAQTTDPRLTKAFGWREFQVLSQTSSSLQEGEVRQLDLGRKFLLQVKLMKKTKPSYFIRCQLLQDEKEILQTTVSMTSGSAYFITGPACENGQLLISVAIR
ncbi:MAG: hypothetical protein WC740_11940 [Verrucomicrobiia bacterium]